MYRHRSISSALAALLVLGATLTPSARAADPPAPVAGEVVAKLRNAGDLAAVAAAYGLDPVPIDRLLTSSIFRLRVLGAAAPQDVAEALAADPQGRVLFAEPNQVATAPEARARFVWASSGTPAEYAGQWAAATIGLPAAHAVTRGAGRTVAVLDTGVDATHPELVGRVAVGYDFVDGDADPAEVGTQGTDLMFGHGTHVAGIVALAAPDARIMPVRVLAPNGEGSEWAIAKGLLFAADPDGNPATHDGADVINLSLGSASRSRLLRDVIGAVTSVECAHSSPGDLPCLSPEGTGPVVVIAAGNDASSQPQFPAGDGAPGAIAVGASTAADLLAPYSNFGSWVDVAAPGDAILSSVPGGGYASWSGTSMAAPFVSAEAALVRAAWPNLSTSSVVRRVLRTSDRIRGPVRLRVDAAAAVLP